jgi:hypothetical protein
LLNVVNNAKEQIKEARENKLIKRGSIFIQIYNYSKKATDRQDGEKYNWIITNK